MFQENPGIDIAGNIGNSSFSWICLTLVFVIGVGGFIGLSQAQAGGRPAPDFSASTLEGDEVTIGALEGEPALLMFWAPWCGVCKRELPKLAYFYEAEKPDGLQVVSIAGSDTEDNVQEYVDDNPDVFVFPTVYDEGKIVARDFRIKAFPTYVLLDGEGNIVLFHRGSGLLNKSTFRNFMAELP